MCSSSYDSNCSSCIHSLYVEDLDQPMGCVIGTLVFSQSDPQPISCPDFIPNDHYEIKNN